MAPSYFALTGEGQHYVGRNYGEALDTLDEQTEITLACCLAREVDEGMTRDQLMAHFEQCLAGKRMAIAAAESRCYSTMAALREDQCAIRALRGDERRYQRIIDHMDALLDALVAKGLVEKLQ